ncbi:DUF3789 domain-containing protein [Variovorax ginsengisoli]|uniref:DUF3789 domain-containing protein n=1 Tax=Variovorax ginsengisoli TaxID=363844 RepID=UPI003522328F
MVLFLTGVLIGSVAGVFLMCLVAASKSDDDENQTLAADVSDGDVDLSARHWQNSQTTVPMEGRQPNQSCL